MPVTKLQRRLGNLEALLTDRSGLIPHSPKWLEYWDKQVYLYLTDQVEKRVLFPVDAFRAVIKHAEESAGSLVGGIPNLVEGRAQY